MSDFEYSLRPEETYLYDRLDVPPDADTAEIDKAGKLAFKRYAESDREKFFPLREAREVLTDENKRVAYDRFCEELGVELGTEAFSKWDSRGANQQKVAYFVRQFSPDKTRGDDDTGPDPEHKRDDEPAGDETDLWERLNVKSPVITWADGKARGAMNTNLWTTKGKRLYINNFHPMGDIYLDLETDQFYTGDYERVEDVDYTTDGEGDTLYVWHDDVRIKIDLRGASESNTLKEHLTIDEPEIVETNFNASDKELNVNLWEESQIYLNGIYPKGPVYIWLETGTVHEKGRETKPISDVSYDVSADGTQLQVTCGEKEVLIDLVGNQDRKERTPSREDEIPERDDHSQEDEREREDESGSDGEPARIEMSEIQPINRPGVWVRENIHPVVQVIGYILILALLESFLIPQSTIIAVGIFVFLSILLYAGGIVACLGLGATTALLAGRIPLAAFYAVVGGVAVFYYKRIAAAMNAAARRK